MSGLYKNISTKHDKNLRETKRIKEIIKKFIKKIKEEKKYENIL